MQQAVQERIVQMVQGIHGELSRAFWQSRSKFVQRDPGQDFREATPTDGGPGPVTTDGGSGLSAVELRNPFANTDINFDDMWFNGDFGIVFNQLPAQQASDSGYMSFETLESPDSK